MNTHFDPAAIYLGRQPILDRAQQLVGFEFLFRNGPAGRAIIDDHVVATATVVAHAFSELGLGHSLGKLHAFINVDEAFLLDDAVELLPPQQVVLEILEGVRPTPAILERCQKLKALGFQLALDDIGSAQDERLSLLPHIGIAKVDLLTTPAAALADVVAHLRRQGLRLLAEKIENGADIKRCIELGFDLFQGFYFAHPALISGRKISHSKLALLKLQELLSEDAETRAIEAAFKQAPGLSLNLLRLVNSVGSGLTIRITSLRHAITVLGRRQLQRWLQLLLYTDGEGQTPLDSPLLQLAATRGRVMENLARPVFPGEEAMADQSFMVGVLSLTPALFGIPMDEILQQVNLAPHINDALLSRKGKLGQMLRVVEATERDEDAVGAASEELPALGSHAINTAVAEALAWANAIGEEAHSE
jgi:c-di-GMP-related signal transduction protein